ncbi:hypothetical protein O3M35_004631 [Rhynocoris fuscipes]|uniref:Uncharacterized protein n=1 Tax=Rhynocoris fuscipes TaxID=488301 RepID=A0AAW1CG27_9HEMI
MNNIEDNNLINSNSSESSEFFRDDMIILSIFEKRSKIAAASFNYITDEIEVLSSFPIIDNDYGVLKMILMDKKPV